MGAWHMRRVEAFVPFLPTTYLSPNQGERKEGRVPVLISESKRQYRAATALWLLEQDSVRAIEAPFEYARASIELHWLKRKQDGLYRPEDPTNAVYALKAFFDGLIDAGLIVDDGYKHMELGYARVCPKRAPEGVYVTVEECDRPSSD